MSRSEPAASATLNGVGQNSRMASKRSSAASASRVVGELGEHPHGFAEVFAFRGLDARERVGGPDEILDGVEAFLARTVAGSAR